MQNQSIIKIREIFTSIQGEGPYVGENHIFVRFCKCNLRCNFCDTDFDIKKAQEYTDKSLYEKLKENDCEVISFTGGEPLLDVDFLKNFLSNYKEKLNKKIYLETNGTMPNELAQIIDLVDVISMDIKLKSATGQDLKEKENDEFLKISTQKEVFAKIVFDENITNDEIEYCINLAKKYDVLLILQPKMPMNKNLDIEKIYDKFYAKYKKIRLIPQVHKFLNIM